MRIEAIVGERGKTRRTKQYRILWEGFDSTTWEPMANLDHADLKIKEWLKRTPEQQQRLMSATDAELVVEMRGEDSEAATVAAIEQQPVRGDEGSAAVATEVHSAAAEAEDQEPTKVEGEFEWQTMLCAECAPAPDIQALIAIVDNSWVQCCHGTVRVEGLGSQPEGLEMTRCHQPSCVEEAERWWRENREDLTIPEAGEPDAKLEMTTACNSSTQTSERSIPAVIEEEAQVAAASALLKRVQLDVTPKPGTFTLLMKTICKLAEISMEECASFVCSPPCETFSLADASNLSRNNHTRDHSDRTKPPRSAKSCKTQLDWSRRRKAV